MRSICLGAVLVPLLCAGQAIAACKPLALVTAVDLAPTKDIRPFVPVLIGGKPKLMLVDTGGVITEMSIKAADELGLKRVQGAIEIFDVSGRSSDKLVHTSMKLGRLTADDMAFIVSPSDAPIGGDPDVAGVLAPDILGNYDLDIDFGTRKLNLLWKDHCEGKVIYWPATAVAVIPFTKMYSGHIQFTVKLDGRDVVADFDTGATNTTLTRPVAERDFGLKVGDADTPKIGQLTGSADTATFVHSFKTLDLGGIAITNPRVIILPDMTRNVRTGNGPPEGGSRFADRRANDAAQSMLIGMNVLKHLHIYIAYDEKKIYVTPAGEPPGPATAGDDDAAH